MTDYDAAISCPIAIVQAVLVTWVFDVMLNIAYGFCAGDVDLTLASAMGIPCHSALLQRRGETRRAGALVLVDPGPILHGDHRDAVAHKDLLRAREGRGAAIFGRASQDESLYSDTTEQRLGCCAAMLLAQPHRLGQRPDDQRDLWHHRASYGPILCRSNRGSIVLQEGDANQQRTVQPGEMAQAYQLHRDHLDGLHLSQPAIPTYKSGDNVEHEISCSYCGLHRAVRIRLVVCRSEEILYWTTGGEIGLTMDL